MFNYQIVAQIICIVASLLFLFLLVYQTIKIIRNKESKGKKDFLILFVLLFLTGFFINKSLGQMVSIKIPPGVGIQMMEKGEGS